MTENSQVLHPGSSSDYISALEERITQLEDKLQKTEHSLNEQTNLLYRLEGKIPETSIISPKFLTRAFAVWGHVFVAQLMIAVPIYTCVFLAALGSD